MARDDRLANPYIVRGPSPEQLRGAQIIPKTSEIDDLGDSRAPSPDFGDPQRFVTRKWEVAAFATGLISRGNYGNLTNPAEQPA